MTAITSEAETPRTDRIAIKAAGRIRFVEQASIDWSETQGNYLALHARPIKQLVRRTSTDFGTELDMNRFVRIHRRMIVAIDRIEEMKPLANRDAMLRLRDVQELRMSRRDRDEVVRRWDEAQEPLGSIAVHLGRKRTLDGLHAPCLLAAKAVRSGRRSTWPAR